MEGFQDFLFVWWDQKCGFRSMFGFCGSCWPSQYLASQVWHPFRSCLVNPLLNGIGSGLEGFNPSKAMFS